MAEDNTTAQLQDLLVQLQAGGDKAREQLIQRSCERLRQLTHRMLRRYPSLQRWEQTDDVLQNATVRLYKSLQDIKPDTVGKFFGLASTQIRRELLDLCRHHFGPEATAKHYKTNPKKEAGKESPQSPVEAKPAPGDSGSIEAWTAFHDQVGELPERERQIVDLLFYQEMPHAEAASLLGVDVRTIRRWWQSARIKLHEALNGRWPE